MRTKSPREDPVGRPRPPAALNPGMHAPSRRGIAALAVALLAGAAALGAGWDRALAADSLYGKVTEVRAANVVVLDYGTGRYVVRLIGIEPAREGRAAAEATEFVRRLVLGKSARLRFESSAQVAISDNYETHSPLIPCGSIELLRPRRRAQEHRVVLDLG